MNLSVAVVFCVSGLATFPTVDCVGSYKDAYTAAVANFDTSSLPGNELANALAKQYEAGFQVPTKVTVWDKLWQKYMVAPKRDGKCEDAEANLKKMFEDTTKLLGVGTADEYRIVVFLFECDLMTKASKMFNNSLMISPPATLYAIAPMSTFFNVEGYSNVLGCREFDEPYTTPSTQTMEEAIIGKFTEEMVDRVFQKPGYTTAKMPQNSVVETAAFGFDLKNTKDKVVLYIGVDYVPTKKYKWPVKKSDVVDGKPGTASGDFTLVHSAVKTPCQVKVEQQPEPAVQKRPYQKRNVQFNLKKESEILTIINRLRDIKNEEIPEFQKKKMALKYKPIVFNEDEELQCIADGIAMQLLHTTKAPEFQKRLNDLKLVTTNISAITFTFGKVESNSNTQWQNQSVTRSIDLETAVRRKCKTLEKQPSNVSTDIEMPLDIYDLEFDSAIVSVPNVDEKTRQATAALILTKTGYRP